MEKPVHLGRCKNAKIFYRILPMTKMHWENVKILEDMKTIYVRCLQDFGIGKENCEPSYWKFETDGLFYNNSQDEIYKTVTEGILENVMKGSNAVIIAFGQTSSGKSLTISGVQNSFQDRGIAPRVISDLFQLKETLKGRYKMCIKLSYIEVKEMYVSDLLGTCEETQDLHILKNIVAVKVKNEYKALKTLFKAEGRRQFLKDSLSHAASGILTLHVITKQINKVEPSLKISKLHIVDLAGIDNYGNILSFYKTLLEVGSANLAKSQLEQFILVLCQNIPELILVKQRLNVLIQYLSDSLNAESLLRFIGHIRTDKENLLITLSLLRFGQIVQGLQPKKLKVHEEIDTEKMITILQDEINEMKRERDLNIMINNGDLSANLTQQRIKHMSNVAEEYLHDKTNEIVVLNVTDVTTVLKVFKDLYNKLESEKLDSVKFAYEKAYEDALANIKKQSSKTDSLSSTRSSRKGSRKHIKSKESLLSSEKVSPKTRKKSGKSSISRTESYIKIPERSSLLSKQKSHDNISVSVKRKKTSSFNAIKRSSTSRRKSASSTATAGTITEEVLSLNLIPGHEEAWQSFKLDENYKDLIGLLELNEINLKDLHKGYLNEVKNLQKFIDLVEIRQNELQKAQMQRQLEKQECNDEGNIIISEMEKLCLENLKKANREQVEQQEKILKGYAELRIGVESYQSLRKNVQEQFEQFCLEKFQIPLPNVDIPSFEVVEEKELIIPDEEEEYCDVSARRRFSELNYYNNLKEVMIDQMKRKTIKQIKNRKWIQSCKA